MTFSSPLDRDEGFTGAFNRTPWIRKFAWLPVRLSEYPPRRAWLRWIEVKEYGAFGIRQFTARLCDSDGTRSAETACPAPGPKPCQARAESIAQPEQYRALFHGLDQRLQSPIAGALQ